MKKCLKMSTGHRGQYFRNDQLIKFLENAKGLEITSLAFGYYPYLTLYKMHYLQSNCHNAFKLSDLT